MDLDLNVPTNEKKKFLKSDFVVISLFLLIPLIELSELYFMSKSEFLDYGTFLGDVEAFSIGFVICYLIFRRKFK